MKPHYVFSLMFVVLAPACALGDWVGLPFLLTSAAAFFALNRALLAYNSRAMLRLRPIPERGYGRRREALERGESQLFNLGFRRTDELYVGSLSDLVSYVYEHRSEPVHLCVYHMGFKSHWTS